MTLDIPPLSHMPSCHSNGQFWCYIRKGKVTDFSS